MTEILLLVFGGIVFTASFFLPAGRKKDTGSFESVNEEQIKEIIDKEVAQAKNQINDIVDETITYSMEKTERSMERLTNEKMMAVNEFSDSVLEQINKNHKEAVFLYDMLNDKHENLKSTVSEAVKTASEVKQTVRDAEITVKESEEKIREEKRKNEKHREEKPGEGKRAAPEIEFVPIRPERVEISIPDRFEEEREIPERTPQAGTEEPEEDDFGKQGKRNNNERILALNRLGMSSVAIAKELGLGVGEVKLVIGLFQEG